MILIRKNSLFFIVMMVFILSCKKDSPVPSSGNNESNVLDSLFLYGQQIYYWNSAYPKKNVYEGKFGSLYNADKSVKVHDALDYLSLLAINPVTNRPYELNLYVEGKPKYSALVSKSGESRAADLRGFGFALSSLNEELLYIKYVIKGSPADNAGLERGDKILSINNLNSSVFLKNENYSSISDGQTLNLTISSPQNEIKNISLEKIKYNGSSDITLKLFSKENAAYISLSNFPNNFENIDNLAAELVKNENLKVLIVDLRYNAGGYLSGCDQVANLIIPEQFIGKVYRKEKYNEMMQLGQAYILKNKPVVDEDGRPLYYINNRKATFFDLDYSIKANTYLFDKKNGFRNLKELFFIVSAETASASEILINSLSPYLKTTIVGVKNSNDNTPIKTFGKPVGSIGIPINNYVLYYAMFQNLNSLDKGDYFDGISSNVAFIDDVSKDFGDEGDPAVSFCLAPKKPSVRKSFLKSVDARSKRDIYNESVTIPIAIKSWQHHQIIIKKQ